MTVPLDLNDSTFQDFLAQLREGDEPYISPTRFAAKLHIERRQLAELAHVHIRLDRYEKARRELERAAALDSENFRANANLLILYQRTKDPRAQAQQERFEEIKKKRSENEQLLWRTIEVRPY